ncbi:LysM peptidoglycan-binding domain-containing protein, partial [Clostridioides difficile]|nr:LysM peptidoglycan-binding domain-containing protein [Clostridioides difficile]
SYIEGNKSIIQGIIKVEILFVPVEGLKLVYKISEEIPFEHDIEMDNLTDTASVFNTACIDKVEVDLNRDQIDLIIKIKRFTEALDKKAENFIIKGEDQGVYDLSKAPSIIVYICKEGDTFWNIAKKYNTTENEIAELNDIKLDEPIKPGKCLILEKKVVLVD